MGFLRAAAQRILGDELSELRENLRSRDDGLTLLQERLAELEMSLEDSGWIKLGAGGDREFSREGLKAINQLARVYWLKNPLIRRAILTQTHYVFGQGINIKAEHPLVQQVVQAFLDDPKNQTELTSHQARMIKETELHAFGNLLFVFFPNLVSGGVRIRTIVVDEIEDIVCNPEDAKEPWYYKRVWTEERFNATTGNYDPPKQRVAYYPDWRYKPSGRTEKINGVPVEWDTPIYHVKVNCLSDMKFGVSEVYAAFDWAKAYTRFLEDWATIVRAYARFAYQLTTLGGTKAVAAAKTKLGSTIGPSVAETNPSPATASTFITGLGSKLEPMRTAGATTSADDGRRLMLMVSSVTGIFEHYLTGDPSTGNLATATAMELPMLIQFRQRQQLWADVTHDILQYVVDCSARATQGKLKGSVQPNDYGEQYVELALDVENEDPELRKEPISRDIEVSFPDILQKSVTERVAAIVAAATLGGSAMAGTLELRQLTKMLLTALGEDDVDELLEQMFPEGEVPAEEPPAVVPGTETEPTPEALMVEAIRELREAVAKLARAA